MIATQFVLRTWRASQPPLARLGQALEVPASCGTFGGSSLGVANAALRGVRHQIAACYQADRIHTPAKHSISAMAFSAK